MFQKLSLDEAATAGIAVAFKQETESGELRGRLSIAGTDVTLTRLPPGPGSWQQAHRHEKASEHSFVIEGWVALVTMTPAGALLFDRFAAGQGFRTHPGRAHNLYVSGGTVLSTVKVGDDPDARDWIACPELDERVQGMCEAEILACA